jgi:hypothetical protein
MGRDTPAYQETSLTGTENSAVNDNTARIGGSAQLSPGDVTDLIDQVNTTQERRTVQFIGIENIERANDGDRFVAKISDGNNNDVFRTPGNWYHLPLNLSPGFSWLPGFRLFVTVENNGSNTDIYNADVTYEVVE